MIISVSLIAVSLVLTLVYAKNSGRIWDRRLTYPEAAKRLQDSIKADPRFSKGKRNYVLTLFHEMLIEFAEKEGYKGNIPGIKNFSAYLSPTNTTKEDPQLMMLCWKMQLKERLSIK